MYKPTLFLAILLVSQVAAVFTQQDILNGLLEDDVNSSTFSNLGNSFNSIPSNDQKLDELIQLVEEYVQNPTGNINIEAVQHITGQLDTNSATFTPMGIRRMSIQSSKMTKMKNLVNTLENMAGASSKFQTAGLLDFGTTKEYPTLIPINTWGTSAYTCNGSYVAQKINKTYDGRPPVNPISFTLTTNPDQQYWQIVFGGSVQLANATFAATKIGKWYNIPNVNFNVQVDYQKVGQDLSRDKCLVSNFGLHKDITSGPCNLASNLVSYDTRVPGCFGLDFLSLRDVLFAPKGYYLRQWEFSQLFGPAHSGGVFIATSCTSQPSPQILIPSGTVFTDFSTSPYIPSNCNAE